jgi:hypothetical protein
MESSPELVVFMERMYRSFEAFDAEAFADVFSTHDGTLVIGSAPEEWWEGHHDIAAMARIQFREMPPVHLRIESTQAWREGTVGWIASRAVMEFEGMPPVPTRSTVVLREEGVYWKVLQWHLSMPVANEEALGVELTMSVDAILAMVENEDSPITAANADGEVTIVFTDLEGSTALMETLGEQTWLDLLEWHDRSVRRQTSLFGGTVVKSQGDGFMLAFSSPGAGGGGSGVR